jgi:hypothetical protein
MLPGIKARSHGNDIRFNCLTLIDDRTLLRACHFGSLCGTTYNFITSSGASVSAIADSSLRRDVTWRAVPRMKHRFMIYGPSSRPQYLLASWHILIKQRMFQTLTLTGQTAAMVCSAFADTVSAPRSAWLVHDTHTECGNEGPHHQNCLRYFFMYLGSR